MGELAVSASADDELVSIGLGSCIGLTLIDRAKAVAALAHVMLPNSAADESAPPGKYADRAVPALIAAAEQAGARRVRLEAVIVGGAQMFKLGSGSTLDVGARNTAAVRVALDAARIPLRAEQTGGSRGRTVRVHVGTARVTVKEAGGQDVALFGGARAPRPTTATGAR
ncbi:MAG: CheD, stimulates methylation of protein [Conexibacter sp.]|jgi:chemotaxis protein CheD|nr:CheD, stimulates methylation of protein [Conexibacter sp.]